MSFRKKRSKVEGLISDLHNLRDSFAHLTGDMKKKTAKYVHHAADNVKKKGAHLHDEMDSYLTERPYKSIGVALLAGMVLGFLLTHNDD
jgi:ElaB/YqjD/DUF883 family membrane-anchored ribosome-binding protein